MEKRLEVTYGKMLRGIFTAINPIKKIIIYTPCTIHKFINNQSIKLLLINGHKEEYLFYKEHINDINKGTEWADQDFKSSNHFYNFKNGKGLYGFSNALAECKKYYIKSINYYLEGDVKKAMFYLGAACHLLQDSTVPQHVNNKLLKNHREFELWILKRFDQDKRFIENEKIEQYKSLVEYFDSNAALANFTHLKNFSIKDKDIRYGKVATTIIRKAQSSTAGFMLDFYNSVKVK